MASIFSDFERDILPGKGLERDETLRNFYRQLIAIRRAHSALWRGTHELIDHGPDHLVFARSDESTGDRVVVAINRGPESMTLSLATDALTAGTLTTDTLAGGSTVPEAWIDLLTDTPFTPSAAVVEISLPARSGRILAAAPVTNP